MAWIKFITSLKSIILRIVVEARKRRAELSSVNVSINYKLTQVLIFSECERKVRGFTLAKETTLLGNLTAYNLFLNLNLSFIALYFLLNEGDFARFICSNCDALFGQISANNCILKNPILSLSEREKNPSSSTTTTQYIFATTSNLL